MQITINFIGCGRVGVALAGLFCNTNQISIAGMFDISYTKACCAVELLGQGAACKRLDDLPYANIYFITTPDDVIADTCLELISTNHFLSENSSIVHCSGTQGSEILQKAKEQNHPIASVHPIKTFISAQESIRTFPGTYCTIEGDEYAVNLLEEMFNKVDAKIIHIKQEQKKIYHAATVLATNYLITLHKQATTCYNISGINPEITQDILHQIMQEALDSLSHNNHSAVITGPIQRGDLNTVAEQLQSLNSYPIIKNVYASLGMATLKITRNPKEQCEAFTAMFEEAFGTKPASAK